MKIRYWGILFFLLIMLTAAGCERYKKHGRN